MEQTLIIFEPSAIERALVGKVLSRFEQKGLTITGMKMMQLSEELLRQHYAHLVDRPFFPSVVASMTASPVIVMVLEGVDAINVVRSMTGVPTEQEHLLHASSSAEDAATEIKRFFAPGEIFERTPALTRFINASSELSQP